MIVHNRDLLYIAALIILQYSAMIFSQEDSSETLRMFAGAFVLFTVGRAGPLERSPAIKAGEIKQQDI
ncbi:MAG: hypothetical protein GF350_16995 [Chitinivibrionales bacterium]|nr:hypothetical protein [Chitinivibrionales bacterium]